MLDKEKLSKFLDENSDVIIKNSEKLNLIRKNKSIEDDEISNLSFLERREHYKKNKLL